MPHFPDVPKIPFEGPGTKNPLAFRHYNADEVVEGGREPRLWVALGEALEQRRVEVAEPGQVGKVVEVAREVGAPPTEARNGDTRHSFQTLPLITGETMFPPCAPSLPRLTLCVW
jgi:hypothetical protein